MAEVINDVNPSGRGTGYDWVYNPSPVGSALQFRENMAQQAALRRAALAMQQERLEQRARQASAKDYTMEPVSGGYYNDLLAEDFNNLQSYLVDAYKRGESPANVRQQINAHKQQAKYFDAISKEHDAFLKTLQSDPIVNKDYLNQALQESRISLAEPAWKQRKSRTEMYVPDIKQIHQATLSNPKIWNPAAVGSEVVRTLTGSDSYTFQGPDAKGTTVKRDKILDSKGNVNLEVAKDIVASTPRYNQVYTTLFDAKMKERQNMGIVGAKPTEDVSKLVAGEVMREMFPNTLGDFSVKEDKTGWKPTKGKAASDLFSTQLSPVKVQLRQRSGASVGGEYKANVLSLKKPQVIPEGLEYISYDNTKGNNGRNVLPSGFSYREAVPTVAFVATKPIKSATGTTLYEVGDMVDPLAAKGGALDPRLYEVIPGFKVTTEMLQENVDREGNTKLQTPGKSGKTIFARRGALPVADNLLSDFLNKQGQDEVNYFDNIRNQLAGTKNQTKKVNALRQLGL